MTDPFFVFTSRATPIVQLGLGDRRIEGDEAAFWDVTEWDDPTALWGGVEPLWLDITCHAIDTEGTYGRRAATDEFEPGTASLTVSNATGWADPIPPDDDPALLDLRAGRAIRFGVDHETLGIVWRWRGYIDDTEPRYDPTHGDVVDITATCALGDSGRADVAEVAVAVGANELASARMNRILNAVKQPTPLRSIASTGVHVAGTTFGDSAANLLQICAASAGGAVFGDTEGRVVFKGRDWQMFEDDEPNDGTIGNMDDDADAACPTSWHLSGGRSNIITQVELGRDGVDDEPFTYDDDTGQALYGIEPYTATDLICMSVTDLNRIAQRTFETRGYHTSPRVDEVALSAATSEQALDLMTLASPFTPSRYRCNLELERGEIFDREMIVVGITETMRPDAWTMTLSLDLAEPWLATGGVWDGDGWDQCTWN